ncbi:MAG: class I SAM-dependent methyltransferase, partial [Flavitalea sp.]
MRDLFSDGSQYYAAFRPGYPTSLAEHVLEFTKERNTAWDCATGNGQAAILFSPYFKKIIATDLSEKQLSNAVKADNINYRVAIAEDSGIENHSIDLVTVAQAYHWFDPLKFEQEVRRVCKPGAVLAVWGD